MSLFLIIASPFILMLVVGIISCLKNFFSYFGKKHNTFITVEQLSKLYPISPDKWDIENVEEIVYYRTEVNPSHSYLRTNLVKEYFTISLKERIKFYNWRKKVKKEAELLKDQEKMRRMAASWKNDLEKFENEG